MPNSRAAPRFPVAQVTDARYSYRAVHACLPGVAAGTPQPTIIDGVETSGAYPSTLTTRGRTER